MPEVWQTKVQKRKNIFLAKYRDSIFSHMYINPVSESFHIYIEVSERLSLYHPFFFFF